ncbi:hypothetical protein PIJPGVCJ_CDS0226 [Escherichia phage MIZ5]|nr:hypothetical protein XCVQDTFY_CDS0226 [Krischvirus RB49]WNA15290.1 hypothetical protein PIJPGVCJ_CDS0226 [Krischvirus RB49]
MKPVSVKVIFSESSVFANANEVFHFEDFERKALEAAAKAYESEYDKTQIEVTFENGTTYACRLDLGDRLSGFRHHVEKTIAFSKTEKGKHYFSVFGTKNLDFLKTVSF